MSVSVRAGDLVEDAAPLLRLLQEQLSSSIDLQRFDWLYRRCPHGEAKVWLASEPASGRLLGAAAVFPRRINFAGGSGTGFVLGDFCVSADQRSLGLAIRLQRKCLESIQSGSFSMGYDFPSRMMLAVYRRLGFREGPEFSRAVKLLRVNEKISMKVKAKGVARVLTSVGNTLLALEPISLRMRTSANVQTQEGRCGQEYTDLAREVGGRFGVCVDRSAEYLNWRYLDHPTQKYEILAARSGGRLNGYLVFLQTGSHASIVDWFGQEPVEIRNDLIRAVVARLKSRGCESVQASILASHAYNRDLKALGFRNRESSPVIFFGQKKASASSTAANENWLLMDGDRES